MDRHTIIKWMHKNNLFEIITVVVALLCYILGAPNAGHFFMFCIVINKIEGIGD